MGLVDEIRDALAARRRTVAPEAGRLVVIGLALVVTYIAAAVILVPSGEPPEFNFASERGAITALSSILLAFGSAFALASFLIASTETMRHRLLWLVMGAGLGFLALDELLQFHEQLGYRLDRIDRLQRWVAGTPIRKWDDVVVVLYGVAALPLAAFFLPSALRRPRVAEFLAVAAFLYAIHTLTDSVVEPRTTLSVMFEESAKLLCGAFLALAMLMGLLGGIRRGRRTVRRPVRVRKAGSRDSTAPQRGDVGRRL